MGLPLLIRSMVCQSLPAQHLVLVQHLCSPYWSPLLPPARRVMCFAGNGIALAHRASSSQSMSSKFLPTGHWQPCTAGRRQWRRPLCERCTCRQHLEAVMQAAWLMLQSTYNPLFVTK